MVLMNKFALSHVNKTVEEWNTVIFSDEAKFNLFGSEGRQYVWRAPCTETQNKHLQPTMKFGGDSVMM